MFNDFRPGVHFIEWHSFENGKKSLCQKYLTNYLSLRQKFNLRKIPNLTLPYWAWTKVVAHCYLLVNVWPRHEILVIADLSVDPHLVVAHVVDVGPQRLLGVQRHRGRLPSQNEVRYLMRRNQKIISETGNYLSITQLKLTHQWAHRLLTANYFKLGSF